MGNQNLYAYQYQDDAAEQLGTQTAHDGTAERYAQGETDNAENQRHYADDGHRTRYVGQSAVADTGKRYAYGKGVDARCHSKDKLCTDSIGMEMGLLVRSG